MLVLQSFPTLFSIAISNNQPNRVIMKGIHSILLACFLVSAFACFLASAFDPSPLQDFCVAIHDPKSAGTHPVYVSEFNVNDLAHHADITFPLDDTHQITCVSCSVCEWEVLQGPQARCSG
ncbi:hypothetical protein V6N11_079814 [Hibiscus sabdariffa]|uniref:Uncharacterized protein n=1 Tax=Hibiscus sabdariffa TaxID=183260 RepID=A0ABR2RWJ0_9ROSI